MIRYQIEKAEEGTPAVDNYLAAGWEPFAVVSTPVEAFSAGATPTLGGGVMGSAIVTGWVNVIWFRREVTE